jgi:multisubunit Na+/H+ antiporter MnhF subunit
MQTILRDFLLSFCPAKVRQARRPTSQLTVLRAAMWSGAAQFLITTLVIVAQFKHYFIARSQQMAPHMGGVNSTGEAVITVLVVLEFLFHPLSFLLLYVVLEGVVRFIGSIVTAEIVPSLFVFVFFKISDTALQSIRRRRIGPPVADTLERLTDGRIRISSAEPKSGWNSSITLGIDGQWFEVEREEHAQPPRPYVYILRPAPPGKILRGYQEYHASPLENVGMKMPNSDLT